MVPRKITINIDWEDLNTFINENSRIETIQEKLVPKSQGLKTAIKREIVDIYKSMGLDILSINEMSVKNWLRRLMLLNLLTNQIWIS